MSLNTGGFVLQTNKKERIYVFSSISLDGQKYPTYIGYNLTTGRVDEYTPQTPFLPVDLHHIPDEEQVRLATMICARRTLAKGTVAVTARARAGKDHTAAAIKDFFGNDCIIKPLAEPIYEIDKTINGHVKGKNRESLIMIGQGLREKDPNIWIKVWLRRCIEAYTKSHVNKFVCQDLRQPNEYQFFRNLGAVIVGIKVDEEKRLAKIAQVDGKQDLNDKLLNDETERNAGTYECDYVLVNNYDEGFDNEIKKFIASVLVAKKGW